MFEVKVTRRSLFGWGDDFPLCNGLINHVAIFVDMSASLYQRLNGGTWFYRRIPIVAVEEEGVWLTDVADISTFLRKLDRRGGMIRIDGDIPARGGRPLLGGRPKVKVAFSIDQELGDWLSESSNKSAVVNQALWLMKQGLSG